MFEHVPDQRERWIRVSCYPYFLLILDLNLCHRITWPICLRQSCLFIFDHRVVEARSPWVTVPCAIH